MPQPVIAATGEKPTLIVFLENGGRVAGVDLPRWASRLLDWTTEEYGKLAVRAQARRHYREIVVLEDERATGYQLLQAMLDAGDREMDILMLVHGQTGYACGCDGRRVGADFFAALRGLRAARLARFRLRAVYQMNCYGESLAQEWLSIGAQAVNGAIGVNWLPEPSLSVFLNGWLGGRPYGDAVQRSNQVASRALGQVWRGHSAPHPKIASSQMLVFGDKELRSR
ncbi:MAG: hypothetical protein R2844_21230 [Caldilineales bacterium]